MKLTKDPEQQEARRELIVETLSAALLKDSASMQTALNLLLDGEMLDDTEGLFAKTARDLLAGVSQRAKIVYAPADSEFDKKKVHTAQLAARTLLDEIAVYRESAYWLLPKTSLVQVEDLIRSQLVAYEEVRGLVRFILSKNGAEEDAQRLPQIPANRYLPLEYPELARSFPHR